MSGFQAIARKERGAESQESSCGVQLGESMKLQVLELVFCLLCLFVSPPSDCCIYMTACEKKKVKKKMHRVIERWLNCLGRVEFHLHHWDYTELKTD